MSPDLARVIVVDDNEDDMNLAEGILRKAGGIDEIVGFTDGEEALDALSAGKHADALGLILDVKMPRLNGLEVLAGVRAERRLDRLPVAMWSSSDEPRDIARALELGAQCYFGKYPPVAAVQEMLAAMHVFRRGAPHGEPFAIAGNLLLPERPTRIAEENRSIP